MAPRRRYRDKKVSRAKVNNTSRKARRKKERRFKNRRKSDVNSRFRSREQTKHNTSSASTDDSKTESRPIPGKDAQRKPSKENDRKEIRCLEKLLEKDKWPQTDGLECIFYDNFVF